MSFPIWYWLNNERAQEDHRKNPHRPNSYYTDRAGALFLLSALTAATILIGVGSYCENNKETTNSEVHQTQQQINSIDIKIHELYK
jgi:hypothetical protein